MALRPLPRTYTILKLNSVNAQCRGSLPFEALKAKLNYMSYSEIDMRKTNVR